MLTLLVNPSAKKNEPLFPIQRVGRAFVIFVEMPETMVSLLWLQAASPLRSCDPEDLHERRVPKD